MLVFFVLFYSRSTDMLKFPSLSQRTYRTSKAAKPWTRPTADDCIAPARPAKYRETYDDESMRLALTATEKGLSIRRAASEYNIPKSTLGDRVSGKILPGAKPGRKPYLTPNEEDELVKFLLNCAAIGYGRSRKEVIAMVQGILETRGLDGPLTCGWWDGFKARHPQLSLRQASLLSYSRAVASDRDVIDRYFDLLEETLEKNNLNDKPAQIFNCDETGMPLNPKASKIISQRGDKNPAAIGGNTKTQITVLACVSASGNAMPPMVVWGRKVLNYQLTIGEVPGTFYGLSDNGWMTAELFDQWFAHHFLLYAPSARPLLLLLDGHSSHFCPDFVRKAAQEDVIVFTIPPNTTHLTQPLDKGCFGPLKQKWKEVCHDFLVKNPGKVVTQFDFSQLLSSAWLMAMSMPNVINGFRTTGIYPVDRDKIQLPEQKLTPEDNSVTKNSNLAFVPLFSPSRSRHPRHSFTQEDTITTPISPSESSSSSNIELNLLAPQKSSALSRLLRCPDPPSKLPKKYPKSSARVLTSSECLAELERKKKLKEDKEKQKEARRLKKSTNRETKTKRRKYIQLLGIDS